MLVCVFVTIDTLSLPHKNPIIVRYSVFFLFGMLVGLFALFVVHGSIFVKCGFYYFVCWRFVMCIWLTLHVHVYQILFCKCLSNTSLSFWYPHSYIYLCINTVAWCVWMYEWSCLFVFVSSLFASCPETFPITFHSKSKTNIPIWCVFYLFSLFSYSLFFILILIYLFFSFRIIIILPFIVILTRIDKNSYTYTKRGREVTGKKQTKHKRHIIKALHDNEQFHNI